MLNVINVDCEARAAANVTAMRGARQRSPAFEASALEQDYTDAVRDVLQVPAPRQAALREALMELTNGRAMFED